MDQEEAPQTSANSLWEDRTHSAIRRAQTIPSAEERHEPADRDGLAHSSPVPTASATGCSYDVAVLYH
eukprot:4100394-Pyramimonas_sp.AAC.1